MDGVMASSPPQFPPQQYEHGGNRLCDPVAAAGVAINPTNVGQNGEDGGGGLPLSSPLPQAHTNKSTATDSTPSNATIDNKSSRDLHSSLVKNHQHLPSPTPQQERPPQEQPPQQIAVTTLGGPPSSSDVVDSSFNPASFPWTIGSTDGSFTVVNLMQQQQQIQMKQQQLQSDPTEKNNGDDDLAAAAIASVDPTTTTKPAAVAVGTTPTTIGGGGTPINVGGGLPVEARTKTKEEFAIARTLSVIHAGRSLYHDKLFHQSSSSVEAVLSATCEVMGFDIAEMWLRTGPKTHQLTNSHLRPTALDDSVRQGLVELYYGDTSNERTHRLSPAMCKRAKDANDVVWVTANTPNGTEALRMSISNVRTAVAVPVCHEASNTNITIIYFSIRRIVVKPTAVEFLIHMSLSAAVTSVTALSKDGLVDRAVNAGSGAAIVDGNKQNQSASPGVKSRSEHASSRVVKRPSSAAITYLRVNDRTTITGARLDLQWRQLRNVEYLTDGGTSWIHTAIFDGKPVVVKTLRPECQDAACAINEIELEVAVHSRLNHPNVVGFVGAGWTSKNVRFIVLERLDGGTLTQMLGYDTRIRDRRRRFWRKKQLPYLDVLRCARSLACALQYCHEQAIPGSIVLHRDLKPDNIGFTLDGKVKLIDFGLAHILENADPTSNKLYAMSGETGSLRYMAPEVAEGLPYNHKVDVYSFGMILWEMNAGKRPFNGLSRDSFYEQVVHGGGRPSLNKKWPSDLIKLVSDCWSADIDTRPTFGQIVNSIDDLLANEKGGKVKTKGKLQRLGGMIDRHSTWF